MLLAALADAGGSLDSVRRNVALLGLGRVVIEERGVRPAGLVAKQVDVMVAGVLADAPRPTTGHDHGHGHGHDHGHGHGHVHGHGHENVPSPSRSYTEIRTLISSCFGIPEPVREIALRAFRKLAEAESLAHGVSIDKVHFHEVGAEDAITDIVGVATLIEELGITEVVVSPVPLGRTLVRGAHGPIPVPGPATLHLLRGALLVETPIQAETVTPTGAALIAALADHYGPVPSMVLERIGVGAGHMEFADRPNVVRALLGRAVELHGEKITDDCVIEANIDDMSPELFPALERALFEAGAVDVWRLPITMKKGRVGVLVSALAKTAAVDQITSAYLLHSTTLGVRVSSVSRFRAPRRFQAAATEFGEVRVKISERPEGPALVMPEFDDCERLAAESKVSVRVVYEAAQRSIWARADSDTTDLPLSE